MRASRVRREAEITEPVRAALAVQSDRARRAEASKRALEQALASKIAPRIMEMMQEHLADAIRRQIAEALMRAKPEDGPITVTLDPWEFRMMRPGDWPAAVLRRYGDEIIPHLSVNADVVPDQMITASIASKIPM